MNLNRLAELHEQIALAHAELADALREGQDPYFDLNALEPSPTTRALQQEVNSRQKTFNQPSEDPRLYLMNSAGYSLLQCLNTQLKKFDAGEWAPTIPNMAKQASTFNISLGELFDIIRSHPQLRARFSQYPSTGFRA